MKTIKITLLISLFVFGFAYAAAADIFQDEIDGSWTVRIRDDKVRMRLTIYWEEESWGEWNMSADFNRDELRGLRLDRDHDFVVTREAGTMSFHGKVTGTRGYGTFTFSPGERFRTYLEEKGFKKITDEKMVHFFISDINRNYLDRLERLGYSNISSSRLEELAIHRVTGKYIDEIQSLGFRDFSLSRLLEFKIHGVKKKFVEEMKDMGYSNLSPSKVLELRIHGVKPEFIKEIRSAGFPDISLQELLEFRIHGVNKEYIEYAKRLLRGRKVTIEKIVSMKIHGV